MLWLPGAQLDIWLERAKGKYFARSAKIFLATPLNIFIGGQEKCVLYLNNKKLTLPTGYSVISQHIWYKMKQEIYSGQGRIQGGGGTFAPLNLEFFQNISE